MRKPKVQPKISLLIPFTSNNEHRQNVFKWLIQYWKNELPDAEIIIGHSMSVPFCKTEALNNAAKRANGKVLVVLDGDAYLDGSILDSVADIILEELDLGNKVWYVPYRNLYRLNEDVTMQIIESDPADPIRVPDPPPDVYLDNEPKASKYGRAYAALAYMIPREALDALGCFDERFNKGWGGEDISTLLALDTLYGKHKSTDNGIFHLWHPKIGDTFRTRAWEGQTEDEPHRFLTLQYRRASQSIEDMQALVDEGCDFRDKRIAAGIVWQGLEDWIMSLNDDLNYRNRAIWDRLEAHH